jgi:hypothetical protein
MKDINKYLKEEEEVTSLFNDFVRSSNDFDVIVEKFPEFETIRENIKGELNDNKNELSVKQIFNKLIKKRKV